MREIEALIPSARLEHAAGLRAFDADALARYVADPAHPWWRRRPCALALDGRVPEARVPELIARVCDPDDTGEVRQALLEVVADRTELLPWLRHEDRQHERSFGMPEAFLLARGRLGDLSAVEALVTLAADPWARARDTGRTGLDALVAQHGLDAVLAGLGDARPEDRMFRIRMRARNDEDVTDALADPDRTVAHLAQSLADDPDRLRAYIGEAAATTEAKLWAAYALYRLTEDTTETRAIYDTLERPRVEVAGLDDELRAAIVHEYAPHCQRQSDPRWRIEALCTDPPMAPDMGDRLHRATSALTTAGLAPGTPVSSGDDNQQGDGTYYVIPYGDTKLYVSSLGPFATDDDDDPVARRALESAGFRWIDHATGSIRVTDLCVYHFGSRGPLDVGTLLFYWQD
ncbi:hypothetical protein ACWGI8_04620 [Streptomyces sp. NPDC054841]